ncbi:MAG TPA: hypothetical protein DCS93_25385 [Microscillaceae bacterium]|nr:hypothetical protein [Microscillaceae bacterium]
MRLLIQKSLLAGCLLLIIQLTTQAQEDKGAPFKKSGDAFVKQEKFTKALTAYQKMLEAYQGAKDPEGIAEAHKFIGLAYRLQADYDSSAYYYNKSIDLHAKIYGQKSSFVAGLQRDLGMMLQEQGKYTQAMSLFQKSLAISQYINRKALAAFNYIHIGELLTRQNLIDSALVCYNKALEFRKQIYSANDYRLAEIYNLQGEIYTLKKEFNKALKLYEKAAQVNKIDALERLRSLAFKAKTLQLSDPKAAQKAYQQSDAYIETLRGKMKNQADRVRLGKTADEINQGGIETSLKIKDYKTAFYFYEREESNAIVALYPKNRILDQESIRDVMEPETALLEYAVTSDAIYVFVLTKEDFKVTKLNKKGITQEIDELRKAINQKRTPELKKLGFQLYQRLLKPIEATIASKKHLIIVPDKVLTLLPFEALLRKSATPSQGHAQLAYLIKDFNITYHFSGSLAFTERVMRSYQRDFMAIAPVKFPQKDLNNLDASAEEIKAITTEFNKKKVYLNQEATREQLVGKTLSTQILHIATHAKFSKAHPEGSRLVFHQSNITYPEIFKMNLEAEMVVLSHCEPGLDQYDKDGGIYGLGHGFVFAGALNVVYPLWQNSTTHTRDFMIQFYKEIAKGGRFSEALRNTKLALIKNPKLAFPYEWAGFMLIGAE